MAGNIKGITITIGGDTSKLDKALKKVNDASKTTSKELREINKSLKFNPKSLEVLEQKQRTLGKAISNTKEKLETLKEAQQQAAEQLKNGDIGQEEYDALTREILKTENQLKSFEGQLARTAGESSKLGEISNALEDVNKASQGTKDELKEINEALKLDPKNVDLAAQKQEVLAKAVNETKEKLDLLKQKQEEAQRAFENGEISAEEYRKIQREIVSTTKELESLQGELDKSNSKWEAYSEKIGGIADKMGSVGSKLTKGVTAPILGVATALTGLAKEAGETADRLLDLSDITGMSVEAIQEWQHVAVDAGVSSEAMTAAVEGLVKKIPQLEAEGGRATEALNQLGISYDNLKQMSPDEQVETLMYALADMEDPIKRNALGAQLFGGAWKDLAPILGMGREGIAAAREEAEKLGLVFTQEELEKMNEFRKSFDKLKEAVKHAGLEIGAGFADALGQDFLPFLQQTIIPGIVDVGKAIGTMIKAFNELPEPIKKAAGKAVVFAATLGPILKGSESVIKAFLKVGDKSKVLIDAFKNGGKGAKVLEKAIGLLLSPFGAYIIIAGAAVAAGVLIVKNWDKIKEAASKLKESLKRVFDTLFDIMTKPFKKAWEVIEKIAKKLKEVFDFKWELPKFKLPKIEIKGKFALDPPSAPTFNITWRKKGAIFTRPTIFNTPQGYQGVGEAGAEAVLPIDKLKEYMREVLKEREDEDGKGNTYIFNVKLDEVSEIEEFIEMAKRAKRLEKQGEVDYA
ncbi:MAG: hypothetical protein Q4P25_04230 [Tissierellia bacterium]|nr:hypothetical protein [Tissierellia bacterium]